MTFIDYKVQYIIIIYDIYIMYIIFAVVGASLSSFMKSLLLQTMLEDEKVSVTITSHGLNYQFISSPSGSAARGAFNSHLGTGVGHSTRTMRVSMFENLDNLAQIVTKQG